MLKLKSWRSLCYVISSMTEEKRLSDQLCELRQHRILAPKTFISWSFILFLPVIVIYVSLALKLSTHSSYPSILWGGTFNPDQRLDVTGKLGAVASDVKLCSDMGVNVLKQGGSAADAAVTVALCIGSVNFQSSGLGGGGFITVRHPNGSAWTIDCRETAPAKAHKHIFDRNPRLAQFGGLATAIPGEAAGLEMLHEYFGSRKLSWKQIVQPVADLNRRGFAASRDTFRALQLVNTSMFYSDNGGWTWLWPKHNISMALPPVIRRENLARTLDRIAEEGAWAFYDPHGEIAPHIAMTARMTGGVLEAAEFAHYRPILRKALRTQFLGREVYTSPVPSSGPALLMGLHVIEKLLEPGCTDLSPVDTQRLVEVLKWMAAARSELGDPDFVDNPRIEEIMTTEWADRVRANVSDDHTLNSWSDYHPSYEMNDPHGTAHFSIIDKDGMVVSMTTTINLYFGNLVADPATGIILNSEMDDFSIPATRNSFELQPSIYNFIEPGKRPLSSTAPSVFIRDGIPELAIGAAGGSRILTAVFEAVVRKYGYELPLLETISFPRLHHQLIPNKVFMEFGIPLSVRAELEKRGHETQYMVPLSVTNGIFRDEDGLLHAVSDFYRKGGVGAAY